MKVPYLPGVYCMKAVNSKLIYIGSSNNIGKRKIVHMYHIRHYKTEKGCKEIMDAYHSGDYVEFEVIELCNNYLEREQYWLDFYKGQDHYKLINQFDAIRGGSKSTNDFKLKMSEVMKDRWLNPEYRKTMSEKLKKTQLTSESLSKKVHAFTTSGIYIGAFYSAKAAAYFLSVSQEGLSAAARGKFRGTRKIKNMLFVYDEVLDKLDELLEAHQELRVISSEAWEAAKSSTNVQRLMSEQASNNLNTSVQQPLADDIV